MANLSQGAALTGGSKGLTNIAPGSPLSIVPAPKKPAPQAFPKNGQRVNQINPARVAMMQKKGTPQGRALNA